MPPIIKAESLLHPTLTHAFFTRQGGHSTGFYASLNAGRGSHDNPATVEQNLETIRLSLAAPHLLTLKQIHSATVLPVTAPWHPQDRPEADALATATPGLALGILAADCVPLLFADTQNGVIAAAHAGWKGATFGIIEATVQAMEQLGANRARIKAASGPAIAQPSYQVSDAFRATLLATAPQAALHFAPDTQGHWRFDIKAFTTAQCQASGIACESLPYDTYPDETRFFSFRRTTHRGEADYGRQLSAIMLKA